MGLFCLPPSKDPTVIELLETALKNIELLRPYIKEPHPQIPLYLITFVEGNIKNALEKIRKPIDQNIDQHYSKKDENFNSTPV